MRKWNVSLFGGMFAWVIAQAVGFLPDAGAATSRPIISGSTNRIVTPDQKQQEEVRRMMLEQSPGGGTSAQPMAPESYVPPSPQPQLMMSKKLEEFIDLQRNWMFAGPEAYSKNLTTEEALGVKNSNPDSILSSKKGVVDKYFDNLQKEGTGKNPKGFTDFNDKNPEAKNVGQIPGESRFDFQSSMSKMNSSQSRTNGMDLQRAPSQMDLVAIRGLNANSGSGTNQNSEKLLPGNVGNLVLPRLGTESMSFNDLLRGSHGGREVKNSDLLAERSFNDLLKNNSRPATGLNGPRDPLGMTGDLARDPVKPSITISSLEYSGSGGRRSEILGSVDSIRKPAIGGFDEPSSRSLGALNNRPDVVDRPTSVIREMPKGFEIPKRAF